LPLTLEIGKIQFSAMELRVLSVSLHDTARP
jgi:hypothetical protein